MPAPAVGKRSQGNHPAVPCVKPHAASARPEQALDIGPGFSAPHRWGGHDCTGRMGRRLHSAEQRVHLVRCSASSRPHGTATAMLHHFSEPSFRASRPRIPRSRFGEVADQADRVHPRTEPGSPERTRRPARTLRSSSPSSAKFEFRALQHREAVIPRVSSGQPSRHQQGLAADAAAAIWRLLSLVDEPPCCRVLVDDPSISSLPHDIRFVQLRRAHAQRQNCPASNVEAIFDPPLFRLHRHDRSAAAQFGESARR